MMKRKPPLFIIPLVLWLACFFSPAHAEDSAPDADFELLQNRFGGVTITAYRGAEKNVVIPETIGGVPVTVIGNKAFYRKDLESVTIPETVNAIEPLAFAENRLDSVLLSGCVFIGYEAFAGNRLARVVLSEQLVSIGPRAFLNNSLFSVVIHGRVTNIGRDAFTGNPLDSITLADNRNIFTSQGFELSLVNCYVGTGRKAGLYVKDGRIWTLREGAT
ncbi:MAG: leucine-rich repeat domain-containing protein [Treponema sp.]|jgi:hypothetical protein|nr:leucine-rich repeat domain-containing protein [Treponema sp.]